MKARAKKHRDFVGHVVAQQFFNAAHHKARLAGIAQGGYKPDRFAPFLAGKQRFTERFCGMGQQAVGYLQHGLGGAVVFFQADEARTGKNSGKVKNIAHISPAKGVDGLRLVAHGHHIAGGAVFRPGQQPHNAGLHQVGVLIFVHKNMAEALAQAGGGSFVLTQQGLKLKEQVVIVHEAFFAPIGIVGIAQSAQAVSVGQQVKGIAAEHLVQRQFLVAGLAEQPHHGLGFGKRLVALAKLQVVTTVLYGCGNVCRVHHRKGAVGQPCGLPAAQHAEGKGVKGSPLHTGKAVIQQQACAVQHFLCGLAGKGKQQHGFGRNAVSRQPGQTVNNGAGFTAACPGYHQHRAVAAGGGFVLGFIKRLSVINHGTTLK